MLRSFLGKKVGMTHIFDPSGNVVPVTVIQAGPCYVTQIKTREKDGYEAVQVGFDEVKRLNKPRAGHLKNVRNLRHLREVKSPNIGELSVGQESRRTSSSLESWWTSSGNPRAEGLPGR